MNTELSTMLTPFEHYEILKSGVSRWNKWRVENPYTTPDLGGADLKGVSLRAAYLNGADLRDAGLRDADLRFADLRVANLSYANLRVANLSYADLRSADLRSADLTGTHLSGAIGNGKEVCSFTFPERTVTWTATHIFIGCQTKTIEEWFSITDAELDEMSSDARERWRRWEPAIKALLKANPPVKTKGMNNNNQEEK